MTIKEFETLEEAIANVVICNEDDKYAFNAYIAEVHENEYERMGKKADNEPCKNIQDMKAHWQGYVGDERLKAVGEKIFDALMNAREAYAMSFGG